MRRHPHGASVSLRASSASSGNGDAEQLAPLSPHLLEGMGKTKKDAGPPYEPFAALLALHFKAKNWILVYYICKLFSSAAGYRTHIGTYVGV